ncbi:hypothetical protein JCM11491_006347 [Sporobolomyces phaffii]
MLEKVTLGKSTIKTLRRLRRLPSASTQVRAITAHDGAMFSEIIQSPVAQMWSNVVFVYLKYLNLELDFGLLAIFPSLATLHCQTMTLRLGRPEYTFLALQLFEMFDSTVSGSPEDVQAVFSAATMPSIRSLTLDVEPGPDLNYEQTFRNLFPQITSLALIGNGSEPDYSHLTPYLPLMPRLAHLLLDNDLCYLPEFLAAIPTPVKLDSFHLLWEDASFGKDNPYSDVIIAIAPQDEGANIRARRVYLYVGPDRFLREVPDLPPHARFVKDWPSWHDIHGTLRRSPL